VTAGAHGCLLLVTFPWRRRDGKLPTGQGVGHGDVRPCRRPASAGGL